MQKALRKECTFLRASLLYPINRNKICPIPGGCLKWKWNYINHHQRLFLFQRVFFTFYSGK